MDALYLVPGFLKCEPYIARMTLLLWQFALYLVVGKKTAILYVYLSSHFPVFKNSEHLRKSSRLI